MSEEKASPCVLHIHGENIQVLPNAMFAIQYICLDPEKSRRSFRKRREAGSGAV